MKKTAPDKKPSKAYQDADYELQHAVVRGEPERVIKELQNIRDAIKK